MLQLPSRWRSAVHARNAVATQLKARYLLRVHALALFAWTFAIGYLMSKLMFVTGMQPFTLRYLIVGLSTYLGFFLGIRIWLWIVDATDAKTNNGLDACDVLDLTEASFDVADLASGVSGDIAGDIGDGIGAAAGEGCVPILVIGLFALIAAALFAMLGPELLIEIAFEAVLAGSLVSTMRLGREPNWLATVFRKTIWTFLIIMFVMMMFGQYAQKYYPDAKTTKEVIHQFIQHKDLWAHKEDK